MANRRARADSVSRSRPRAHRLRRAPAPAGTPWRLGSAHLPPDLARVTAVARRARERPPPPPARSPQRRRAGDYGPRQEIGAPAREPESARAVRRELAWRSAAE